jgi:hypothetical protein
MSLTQSLERLLRVPVAAGGGLLIPFTGLSVTLGAPLPFAYSQPKLYMAFVLPPSAAF